jgi:hypothetical protein
MADIPSLKLKTGAADATGAASWNGTNGIKAQITDLTDLLLERGVLVVSDTTALAMLGPSDARIAIVPSVAVFVYNPVSTGVSGFDVPAAGGGRWQYIVKAGGVPSVHVIGNSTAGTTSFTINHNLKTLFPVLLCYEPANPGGTTGYRLRDLSALATVTSVDEDNSLIDFGATVIATSQYTIVARND